HPSPTPCSSPTAPPPSTTPSPYTTLFRSEPVGDAQTALREAIERANLEIWDEAQQDPAKTGMGSTIVAAILTDDQDRRDDRAAQDRKSTRLNSSHDQNSYAVFCLKKKRNK